MYAPKQTLYKTAYSPFYEMYVKIDSAYTDDRGEWIYIVTMNNDEETACWFRSEELINFTL